MMKQLPLTLLSLLLCAGPAMAIEEPAYKIIQKKEKYEIRSYGASVYAQTVIKADFDDAGNKAFRILVKYIQGENEQSEKISMTAPVASQRADASASGEKIAMTAPVTMQGKDRSFIYRFVLPAKYTLQNAPKPLDNRIKIISTSPVSYAVLQYSGSWSEENYQARLAELKQLLVADGIKTSGEPIFARFNSPFALAWFRRNEIWIPVAL